MCRPRKTGRGPGGATALGGPGQARAHRLGWKLSESIKFSDGGQGTVVRLERQRRLGGDAPTIHHLLCLSRCTYPHWPLWGVGGDVSEHLTPPAQTQPLLSPHLPCPPRRDPWAAVCSGIEAQPA